MGEQSCLHREGAQVNGSITDPDSHIVAWIVTGVFALLAILISFQLVFKHLRNYNKPHIQKYIIRILFMVPIYAGESWFSLRFYQASVYLGVVRDCFEAFVIYSFFALLTEYLKYADQSKHPEEIVAEKNPRNYTMPFCCIEYIPNMQTLIWFRRCALQYVIVRPLMTGIAVIMEATGTYCEGNIDWEYGFPYITLINLFSVTIAMYGLIEFYMLTQDDLAPYRPVLKFVSIKFVIFMTFWQSLVVSGLSRFGIIRENSEWTAESIATGIQVSNT
eukprot:Colp12_sorted_trinity150504_noHs@2923